MLVPFKTKRNLIPVLTTFSLSLTGGVALANGFADDFSTNLINPNISYISYNNNKEQTTVTVDGEKAVVYVVDADPVDDEKAAVEFQFNADRQLSATGMFTGSRPETGTLRFEAFGVFFNKDVDGGLIPDDRAGDVEIEVEINMGPAPEDDWASYCFKERDADGESQPILASGEKCFPFPEQYEFALDTPYTIALGINPETQEMFAEINGDRVTEVSPYSFFEPARETAWTRFRVRDGAIDGTFNLNSVTFDDVQADLSILNRTNRYQTGDYDNFSDDPNRSKEIVDGRLRMSSTVNDAENDETTFLRFSQPSDYIEADLMYSSESNVEFPLGTGFTAVRIAGILFNVISAEPSDTAGYRGNVWAMVALSQNQDGVLRGEYCLIRNDSDDWSVTSDLLDGNPDNMMCPYFDLAVELDTVYNAKLGIDAETNTVTFELGGEVQEYTVDTDVFLRPDETLRLQTRMTQGATGTVVGYFDNLRNDPNALTDEEITAATDNDNDSASDSSGGSGCSLGGRTDTTLLLMLLVSLVYLRRSRNVLR